MVKEMDVNPIFFTHAFPPLKYPRSIQISRLVKFLGRPVHLICCDESSQKDHSLTQQLSETQFASLERVKRGRWNERLEWFLDRASPNLLHIPDPYLPWSLTTAQKILRNEKLRTARPLVSFGQPMSVHLGALRIKKATNVPWIAHFSDPWADNPFRGETAWIRALNSKMERAVIKNADRVVFTSQETLDLVMSKYPTEWGPRARVIPHAFDSSLYLHGEYKKKEDSPFIIRSLGNFYDERTPEPLFKALQILKKEHPQVIISLRVELIGSVPLTMLKSESYLSLPRGLVEVKSSVEYLKSLELMSEADALVMIDAPAANSVFLPSKLIDYIGAGRPILGISPPGTATGIIKDLGGWTSYPDDPQATTKNIVELIDQTKTVQNKNWGDSKTRAQFDAPNVAGDFRKLLDEFS